MFLKTLGISEKFSRNCMKKVFASPEKRNPNSGRKNRTREEKDNAEKFLDEFPKIPSHYCRATTNKMYLDASIKSAAGMNCIA